MTLKLVSLSPHTSHPAHAPASLMFNLSVDSGRHLLNGWGERARLYTMLLFLHELYFGRLDVRVRIGPLVCLTTRILYAVQKVFLQV
jgi:hypothetical protein